MRWIAKAVAQSMFSVLPSGRQINRLFQGDVAIKHIPDHMAHLQKMVPLLSQDMRTAVEIGTGWCPTIALGLTTHGLSVHTYDHAHHVTDETLQLCCRATGGDWNMVRYHAPGDAARTELGDESVDFHFSNAVFEHIPTEILKDMLAEAHRILRPGGLLYHEIDLRDHFSYFDPSISSVNFLKFGRRTWGILGQNSIQYHNRLRASDFISLFRAAGFRILDANTEICPRAMEALDNMSISPEFRSYEHSDLATSLLVLTATKT